MIPNVLERSGYMWFKNRKTGLTWHISDPDHIERLKKDPGYEPIEEPKPKPKPKSQSNKKKAK